MAKRVKKKNSLINPFQILLIVILSIIIVYTSFLIYHKVEEIFASSEQQSEVVQVNNPIQVEVLNGCGVRGLADRITDFLRTKNFDVVYTGNYRSFDVENSIVIDRTGNLNSAIMLADSLGINKDFVIQQINDDYLLDVTLIVGKDFNDLLKKIEGS